jgi:hypothetical protein
VLPTLLMWPLALWMVTRGRPPWGDEAHFLATVRLFGNGLSLDLLRSYPEMSAPLTYLVYSLWGRLAGFDTAALRSLSPLIAWTTSAIWFFVLQRQCGLTRWTLVALAAIVFNPYFVGLSIFVFTDMLALLGLAIVTLSRQYLGFLVPAVIVSDFLVHVGRSDRPGSLTLASLVGLMPLGMLVMAWGWKLAPTSPLRDIYLSQGLHFDPHALSLYLAVPGIYLLPLILVCGKGNDRQWVTASVLATFVLLFAVQPSIAQTREGTSSVGFVHQALASTLPPPLVNGAFWGLATLWMKSLIDTFGVASRSWRTNGMTMTGVFPWIGCLMFLVVMPFSYMPWEKYALPLFMLASLPLADQFSDVRTIG